MSITKLCPCIKCTKYRYNEELGKNCQDECDKFQEWKFEQDVRILNETNDGVLTVEKQVINGKKYFNLEEVVWGDSLFLDEVRNIYLTKEEIKKLYDFAFGR
jgi:hypothetical protein